MRRTEEYIGSREQALLASLKGSDRRRLRRLRLIGYVVGFIGLVLGSCGVIAACTGAVELTAWACGCPGDLYIIRTAPTSASVALVFAAFFVGAILGGERAGWIPVTIAARRSALYEKMLEALRGDVSELPGRVLLKAAAILLVLLLVFSAMIGTCYMRVTAQGVVVKGLFDLKPQSYHWASVSSICRADTPARHQDEGQPRQMIREFRIVFADGNRCTAPYGGGGAAAAAYIAGRIGVKL